MTETRQDALDQMVAVLDTDFFKALSEPTRVQILRHLIANGTCDISAIASVLPQDRSVISRHLRVLADAGLVTEEKQGRHRFYALVPSAFIHRLESILDSIKRCVSVCCPPSK
ncbi:MAG: metalloregulator ArsR/SmtB family transcription factor [Myxococcota bacterium]